MWTDDLLESNRAFAEGRTPMPLPSAEAVPLAIVSCYDPRLDPLLRPALGLTEGEGFMMRTAGAVVAPGSHLLRSLAVAVYLFDVERVLIVGHSSCRMASFPTDDFIAAFRRRGVARRAFGDGDLRRWAGAIATPRQGVLASAAAIGDSACLPRDLSIAGAVLDDESGRLKIILRPGEPLPGRVSGRRDEAAATAGEAPREEEPEHPPPAAAPPPPPAPAPAPPMPRAPREELPPPLAALKVTLERLAQGEGPESLGRLQAALAAEDHALRKLALVRRYVQRAMTESPDVTEAFALLRRQVAGARDPAANDLTARTLADLLGPLLERKGP